MDNLFEECVRLMIAVTQLKQLHYQNIYEKDYILKKVYSIRSYIEDIVAAEVISCLDGQESDD